MRNLSALLAFAVLSLGMVSCQTGSPLVAKSLPPPPSVSELPPIPLDKLPPPPMESLNASQGSLNPMHYNQSGNVGPHAEAVVSCGTSPILILPELYAASGYQQQTVAHGYYILQYDLEQGWVPWGNGWTNFQVATVPAYSENVDFSGLTTQVEAPSGVYYIYAGYFWSDDQAWSASDVTATTFYGSTTDELSQFCVVSPI